jgi:hypothetical protein
MAHSTNPQNDQVKERQDGQDDPEQERVDQHVGERVEHQDQDPEWQESEPEGSQASAIDSSHEVLSHEADENRGKKTHHAHRMEEHDFVAALRPFP